MNVFRVMTARMVMGYILFCTECNGTVLPSGIIKGRMKGNIARTNFINAVNKNGMYFTLFWHARFYHKDVFGNDNYASSVVPRHISNNRGTNPKSPFLGSVWWDNTIENELDQAAKLEDNCIKRCSELEKSMIELCSRYCTQAKRIRDKLVKAKSTHQQKAPCSVPPNVGGAKKYWSSLGIEECHCYDMLYHKLLLDVAEVLGKGVSHIYALNFVQFASMFGFIPPDLILLTSLRSTKSGSYKYVKLLYRDAHMTPDEAHVLFDRSVKILQNLWGPCVTHAICENICCELMRRGELVLSQDNVSHVVLQQKNNPQKRLEFSTMEGKVKAKIKDSKDGIGRKKDCIFSFRHRRSSLNVFGIQNLFRFKVMTKSSFAFQMMPTTTLTSPEFNPKTSRLTSPVDILRYSNGEVVAGGAIQWINDDLKCKSIGLNSELLIDRDVIGQHFYQKLDTRELDSLMGNTSKSDATLRSKRVTKKRKSSLI